MPSWNEIFDSVQTVNAIENQKKKYFKALTQHTKRNCVIYYSCWQQKNGVQGAFSIDDDDRNGFMNALHGLDKSKGLDLILHTPGGDLAATQSIVDYLHDFFNGDMELQLLSQMVTEDDYTRKAQEIYALLNINNAFFLSVEDIAQDYENTTQYLRQKSIDDFAFYVSR